MKNYRIKSKITEDELKRNIAIAFRFLKEINLVQDFKNYLNSQMHKDIQRLDSDITIGRHWADYDKITSIFGKTIFTKYLEDKGLILKNDIRIYEVFAAFLNVFYPSIKVNKFDAMRGMKALHINKEEKKVKIDFHVINKGLFYDEVL